MLGTDHSELGSLFELGIDDDPVNHHAPSPQPSFKHHAVSTRDTIRLEDRAAEVVDPEIAKLFEKQPARPIVVRGEVVDPTTEPQVVILKGTPVGPTINIGTFVNIEKVVMPSRGLPSRRKRRKARSRFRTALAQAQPMQLAAPPVSIALERPSLSAKTLLLVGIALIGVILIGLAIANRPQPVLTKRKVNHA